jgi:hypothetical protein
MSDPTTQTKGATMNATHIHSCMRPSGSWAKTKARFSSVQEAVEALRIAVFDGPDFGIVWSRRIAVYSGGKQIVERCVD